MDIKEEFKQINLNLLDEKSNVINKINEQINISTDQIKNKLLKENIELNYEIDIVPIVNKFYQKIVNINNFVQKNLVFNIKNEPDDIMFLQKNIISITIKVDWLQDGNKNKKIKKIISNIKRIFLIYFALT